MADVNVILPDDRRHDMRMFNQFVLIERHDATEEAAERLIDEILPRRCIRRRHSTMNLGEIVQEESVEDQNAANMPAQIPAKRRRLSMDARIYIAPPEVRPAIHTLRQTDGVVNYCSSFHSIQQKKAHVVAVSPLSEASTSASTNQEMNLSISLSEPRVDITTQNGTFDAPWDITAEINDIEPENSAGNENDPSNMQMKNVDATKNKNRDETVEKETLAQMEQNLQRLRESLGKFFVKVFFFY